MPTNSTSGPTVSCRSSAHSPNYRTYLPPAQPSNAITAGTGAAPATTTTLTSSSNGANAVPLSVFTRFERKSSPLSINRQGQFPVVTLSFNLAPGAALGNAISAIDNVRRDLKMPASLSADFQGAAAAFKNSLSNEGLLIIAALVTVYIVLGILYERFVHPLTILSTLPSAG